MQSLKRVEKVSAPSHYWKGIIQHETLKGQVNMHLSIEYAFKKG